MAGEQIYVHATVDDPKQARGAINRAAKAKLEQDADLAEVTQAASEVSVADAVKKALAHLKTTHGASEGSLYVYGKTAEGHIYDSEFGGLSMASVRPIEVQDFLSRLADSVGTSTAKTARAVIGHACRRAQALGIRDDNPMLGLRVKKSTKTRRKSPIVHDRALDFGEALDLVSKITRDRIARKRDLPDLVITGLNVGGRIGEVLGVIWGGITDLDKHGAIVSIAASSKRVIGTGVIRGSTKNRSSVRNIPVGPHCARMLMRRKRAYVRAHGHEPDPSTPVFPTVSSDTFRDPSNTHRYLRRAFDRAGYEWVVFHALRRSAISLVADTKSLREAADFAGHARVTTTANSYLGRGKVTTPVTDLLSVWRLDKDGEKRNYGSHG